MNPPHMLMTNATMISQAPAFAGAATMGGIAVQDDLCDLTFDELRELPMQVQMGLDLSALD